jgi:hypothetical protein
MRGRQHGPTPRAAKRRPVMPTPSYPEEATLSSWKKAAGGAYDQIEKDVGIGATVALLERKDLDANERKAYDELAAAIKGGKGGAIIELYKKVGDALDTAEKLEAVAKEFAKVCKKESAALLADDATKKAGKWLLKAGPAALEYAQSLSKLGDDLLEQAEKVPTEKITDLDWDLNEWDLSHLLTKVAGIKLRSIALPDKKMVLVTVTGKVGAQAANNATLRAEFFEAAYGAAKKLAPTLKAELENIDQRFRIMRGVANPADVPRLMKVAFDKFEADYAKQADAAIQKIWDDFVKDKAEYRTYKIKTAVSVGTKVGGMAVGVVALGAAGWTGAGTVVGFVALMKNAIQLGRLLGTALQEARELYFEINDKLVGLKNSYAEESGALIGTQEVAKEALARLTGIQLATVPSVKSDIVTFGSKLKGCNVNATKMGSEIDGALREADALAAKLRKLKSELAGVKGVNIDKLLDKHKKMMVEVGKLVAAAADFKEDYVVGKKAIVTWTGQLNELDGSVPDVAKKIQKWGVPLLDFAFVLDGEAALVTSGALLREFVVAATETEEQLKEANDAGGLVVDVTVLITGIIGKG